MLNQKLLREPATSSLMVSPKKNTQSPYNFNEIAGHFADNRGELFSTCATFLEDALAVSTRWRTNIIRKIFFDGSTGWHWTVEQAIQANKAAGVWGVTSGWTAQQLSLCQAFQDSAGTIPVYAVEQPIGLIRDTSGRGNHFYQTDPTKRPTVSARVNLVSNSAFSGGGASPSGWVRPTGTGSSAPVGVAANGDVIYEQTAGASERPYLQDISSVSATVGQVYKMSFELAQADSTSTLDNILFLVGAGRSFSDWLFNGTPVTGSFVPTAPGRVSAVITITNVGLLLLRVGLGSRIAQASTGIRFHSPDLRLIVDASDSLPTYQRSASASDYETIGFPHYAKFNGLSTFLESAAVDFTGTDEVTACVGAMLLSEITDYGTILELGANAAINNGSFLINRNTVAASRYGAASRGSATAYAAETLGGSPAPDKAVLSLTSKISAPAISLRKNGVLLSASAASQGTGNYGNHKAYVGMRAGTSLPFDGRIYGMTVVGKLQDMDSLRTIERLHRTMGKLY